MSNSFHSNNLIMLLNVGFLSLKLFLRITPKSPFSPAVSLRLTFFSPPSILCTFSVKNSPVKSRNFKNHQNGELS